MMALAEAMWDAYNESAPKELKAGEWYIPFGGNIDNQLLLDTMVKLNQHIDNRTLGNPGGYPDKAMGETIDKGLLKIATARCARISYTVVGEEGKEPNYENDIKLHDRLAESGHWSPFEHCARAMDEEEYFKHHNGNDLSIGDDDYGKLIYEQYITGKYTSEDLKTTSFGWSGNFRGFVQYRKMFNNENIK
jgi:hypothetical protein